MLIGSAIILQLIFENNGKGKGLSVACVASVSVRFRSKEQGRNMVYGLRAQSPKYDWDQGSEERAQGSEEWDQGSQGF